MKKLFFKQISSKTKFLVRRTLNNWRARSIQSDLTSLAALHGTDKHAHGYTVIYQKYFQHMRTQNVKILEIGIGGYERDYSGGSSLRMWASYFRNGKVFGIDIESKQEHSQRRVEVFQGDQGDSDFLGQVVARTGALDIVIDDGSHFCSDVIFSFEFLFPHMNEGGIYVVEDCQTSYWPACGGRIDPHSTGTTMAYFKRLADGLNHAEFPIEQYEPSYFDLNVFSVHFYHNLIFVMKGQNDLPSNVSLKDRLATLVVK